MGAACTGSPAASLSATLPPPARAATTLSRLSAALSTAPCHHFMTFSPNPSYNNGRWNCSLAIMCGRGAVVDATAEEAKRFGVAVVTKGHAQHQTTKDLTIWIKEFKQRPGMQELAPAPACRPAYNLRVVKGCGGER